MVNVSNFVVNAFSSEETKIVLLWLIQVILLSFYILYIYILIIYLRIDHKKLIDKNLNLKIFVLNYDIL